ncbi:MAG TPA: hypothetical protein VGJ13_12795 [Pseudonocardiaceae bacterium]
MSPGTRAARTALAAVFVPALLWHRPAPTWPQVRFHAGIGLLAVDRTGGGGRGGRRDLTGGAAPWSAYLLPVGAMLSLVVVTLAQRSRRSVRHRPIMG